MCWGPAKGALAAEASESSDEECTSEVATLFVWVLHSALEVQAYVSCIGRTLGEAMAHVKTSMGRSLCLRAARSCGGRPKRAASFC